MKNIIYFIAIALLFACEKTIEPELDRAERILVVDAWLTQKMERQEIKITRSQPYFENSEPLKIPDATVFVEDLETGETYNFQEGETSYYWDPTNVPFGEIGHNYQLTVITGGETFEAFSRMGRVPPVDTILFHYNEKDLFVKEDYYTAEFMAVDPVGVGDTYWIKAFKNGNYLNKPGELNMAYDASFSAGQSFDGQAFMLPIREMMINPFDENPDKKNEMLPPYVVGDSVYVEIHSIDHQAYEFLWGLYYQISRPGGFAELFSTPLANSLTNIKNTNINTGSNVAGFFNLAAVSSNGGRLTQEIADQVKMDGE